MTYNYFNLFILFFIYSVLGYLIESFCVSMINKKIVLSRGLLVGPYIPIFGTGALIITFLLKKYYYDIFALFFMSMIICLSLEYFVSYLIEKLFSLRWWDYSDKKFNINGRTCLEMGLLFGLAGIFIIRYLNPFLENLIFNIPFNIMLILSIILQLIFFTDVLISISVVIKFNDSFNKYAKDNTKEVKTRIVSDIKENGFLIKRLLKSFPNVSDTRTKFISMRAKFINKIKDSKIK